MSRNALDRMKAQGKAKSKENRTKRREEDMKRYGRNGYSASDKAYINGNYAKVASNKAYGYRQGVKKGEIVRGSDNDWLSDGNIYRTTKVEENQSWKNPTNDKGKQKYAIRSSHKWDRAKTFNDHLNLGVADGWQTAKANQREGKHLSNALEYVKGILKDTVVDAGVDTVKKLGLAGSYFQAGVSGFAEDSGNAFKALADSERTLKDYTKGKSYFVENIKANTQKLNETGWGEDMATFLHEAKQRGDEETIQHLQEAGRYEDAKSYQEEIEKNKARDTNLLNATGFAMDLLAPSTVEDKIVGTAFKTGKGLLKNTAKSFDDMVKGTASVSTGILPSEVAELMSKAKKYTSKGTGASDDVFFSGTKGTTATDKLLDNQYTKAIDRVKDKIKSNPSTSNLGKFVDELDNAKPYRGTQTNIDGRTLNKKYTQTKDGYIPQKTRSVADEINDVVNGKTSGQYSMFGKDGSVDKYVENIQNPNSRYEKVFNKYADDIDALANKLDDMKPENADLMYDYLMKNKPEVYEQLVKGSDEIDEVIHSSARRRGYESESKIKADKQYFGTKNVRDFSNIDKTDDVVNLNDNYNKFNLERISNKNNIVDKIAPRMTVEKGKSLYKEGMSNYLAKISQLDYKGLKQSLNALNDISNMPKNTPSYKKADILNNMLFGGQKVIRDNIPTKTLNNFVDFLEDNINFNIADKLGEKSFTRKGGKIFNLHNIDGELNDISKEFSKFGPAVTDILFEDKMSDIATKLQVPNKGVLTNRRDALQALKKQRTLTTDEYYELLDVNTKIDTWDRMYQEVANMGDEYMEYAQKTYGKTNYTKGYDDAVDELAEKQARIDSSKGRENILKEAQRNLELGSDPSVTASPRSQNLLHNGDVDEWEQMTKGNSTGNIKDIPFKQYKQNYSKDLGLSYVNTKYPIQIRKEKQTLQGVRSYKPVDAAISNLEKLMNKEVALTIKGNVNSREYETLRTLVKDNVKMLNDLGVDNNVYFNHIKQLKMNLLKDGQISVNTRGIKPMSGKVKNTTKGINPLEMAHIKINGKALDNIEELTPDQLQWKYLMTEGAKTIDELFDVMPGSIPQRGDNLGSEISNSLRLNKTNTPQIKNNSKFSDESFNSFTDIQKNIVNMPIDEIKSKGNQLEDMINAMKKQGVPYEEYAALEDTLKFADEVLRLQNSGRLNIKMATFDMPKFDGSVNPFAPIKDSERLIYQVDNVANDVNSLIPKKNINNYIETLGDTVTNPGKLNNPFDKILNKNVDIKTLGEANTLPNKLVNPFDDILNKINDNPFGDIDVEDALKEVENKEAVTLSDFFKKLEDNANKNTPVKEVVRDSKPIPSPSELISMGMTKDEAFDAVTKMRNGEMEIPDLNYKKKVGKDGYTRYERDGINLPKENTPLTKIENQPNPKYKDRKANWGDVYGDKNYVEEKRDLRKYITNPDTGEIRLADAPRKPYPKNNNAAKEPSRYDELNKFTDEGIKRLSKTAMGEDKELVNQILKERGLSVVDDVTEEVVEKAPKSFEEFLTEKGIDVEDIKNKSFADGEEEIYGRGLNKNEIKANEKALKKLPYEDEKLYGAYKSWLNTWKKGLTAYNPGWHVQNFFQNKGQNYLALGPEAFAPQTEARNILKQLNGKKAKDVNIFDKKNMRSYSSEEIGKLAQDLGVLDSLGEDVVNARGIFPKVENAIDNSGFMKWLNQSEQTARLNHFIKQIERGNNPEQAAKLVNKYLFDYSKKSNLDKVMGDFVDPFWTFHKNNAKLMATSAFEHPNRINNIIRATNGLDYGVPQEQLQNEDYKYGKIQMPYASMKDSVNGDQYNYLYSENIMPNIEDALSLEDEDLENKLNPILKLALQHSRGEGNFGNKIVEGDEAGWNEVTKKELLGESLSELNPFAQNLFKTISSEKERREKVDEGKMSQEVADKQILLDWINYITGNKGNLYRNLNY